MPTTPTLFYERTPPVGVVFGCLPPVPQVGAADGLPPAPGPSAGLPDRFAPLSFTLVHALIVGMLLPAMLDALFQLFPVVADVLTRGAEWVSSWVALSCVAMASVFTTGLLGADYRTFVLVAWLDAPLSVVPAALIIFAGMRTGQTRATHATVRTLRRTGWLLLVTLASGATLDTALVSGWLTLSPVLLNLYVGRDLGGWLATLIAGVAPTVLPMFWQTRRLPEPWHRLVL